MKAIISRTLNGAWVRFVDRESEVPVEDLSFEFGAPWPDKAENMDRLVGMIYEITSRLGWDGDRHDRERLQVSVVHGDKFEHADADESLECAICRRTQAGAPD